MPYCVYILTNKTGSVLYTGVTGNLPRRISEHRAGAMPGFTSRYHVTRLVYYEVGEEVTSAIEREKQIKAGSRRKKIELISTMNPTWRDLAEDFLE